MFTIPLINFVITVPVDAEENDDSTYTFQGHRGIFNDDGEEQCSYYLLLAEPINLFFFAVNDQLIMPIL